MCVRLTSITFPVIWSSVLISVTREWRYCGLFYKFFLISNIELKCSFVRCRKYHKSWSNGATELHILVDFLCGTTAAELHNSVNLLCGTTAAELNPVWCMHQESQTFSKDSDEPCWKVKFNSKLLNDERFGRFRIHRSMYALQRFSKLFKRWPLYEDRISDLSKPLKDERWGHKNHHVSYRVKVRQNVSKRLKARQMCVDDENTISKKPPLLIAQDTR